MNIEKILESNLINTAELARRLWSGNQKTRLHNKIHNKNGQRLTEKDKLAIEEILNEAIK